MIDYVCLEYYSRITSEGYLLYAKFSCLCSAKEKGKEKVGQKDRSQGCVNEW